MTILDKTSKELIQRQFEIDSTSENISDEELFDMVADKVAYMLERRLEELMSLMYTLDINERQVEAALSLESDTPANIAITRLIIDRQLKRIETKAKYKQKPMSWDDF